MTILITGGAGFIGAHLAKTLVNKGFKVVLLDNFNRYYSVKLKKDRIKSLMKGLSYTFYQKDICDKKALEKIFQKEKIDKIVHLGAMAGVPYSVENPLIYEEVNIKGTLNLLMLAKDFKIKHFVFASSSSVYGNNQKIPFTENDSNDHPISPYAATKKATELLAYVYSHLYKIKVSGIRYFTVYGPWGRPDLVYFKFVQGVFAKKCLKVFNQGKIFRNFVYIDDAVLGTIKILKRNDKSLFEVFNLGGEESVSLLDLIKIIEETTGKKAKRKFLAGRKFDVCNTLVDLRKLKKIGWKPTISFRQGMGNFIHWYKNYFDKLKNKSK